MANFKRRSRRKDKDYWYPCGCCTKPDLREVIAPQIEENEVCNSKPRKRKPSKKKDKCPAAKSHTWYKETVETTRDRFSYASNRWITEPDVYEQWTCINCWSVKRPKNNWGDPYRRRRRRYSNASWRPYKLELPKRPVKLY